MSGLKIRQFFRELLGSRIAEHLETELLYLRQDFDRQLQEKANTEARLVSEIQDLKAKVDRYELVLLPLASPAGKLFTPKKEPTFEAMIEPESSWTRYQREWYAEQEKVAQEASIGVPSEIGQEVQQ